MGPPRRDDSSDADFVELLREHAELRAAFVDVLRRRADSDETSAGALERRAATLVCDVWTHLDGVAAEAMRRGTTPVEVEAWYALASKSQVGLDFGHAFASAFARGPDDPALRAWRASAESGNADAQCVAGVAAVLTATSAPAAGEGVALLKRAAATGHAPASESLARFERDPANAAASLRRAADAGSADACRRLVGSAVDGRGAKLSVGEAIEWMEKAAAAGHVEASLELGRLRAVGAYGLDVDFPAAHRLLSFAAEKHRRVAREWLDKYAGMTPETYRSVVWLESWTPTSLPTPPRAGRLALVASLALIALLVAAAAAGSPVGMFLAVMFVVVLMHEWGHFVAARLVGVPILVFSVGVGPLVRSFRARGGRLPMRVDLRLLPLMGHVQPYVAPRGIWAHWSEQARRETAGEPPPALPSFDRAEEPEPVFLHVSPPRRLAFLAGGLVVNFVAAVAALWIYEHASDAARLWTSPEAGRVPDGSVAATAGIREGDRFVAVDGEPVRGFFDVQRRLAPLDGSGAAAPTRDAPGGVVALDVRRGGVDVRLSWTTPTSPPAKDAGEAYGLFPPESWVVERVWSGAPSDLRAGDVVVAFESDGRRIAAGDPDSHALMRRSAAAGRVDLIVARARGERRIAVDPVATPARGGSSRIAGFEFAKKKEPGEARGLVEILGRIMTFGWNSIVGLPRELASSLREKPSKEEQGRIVATVRRDPWEIARMFGMFHAFVFFLNLVPIPPLDGFQLLCLGVETAARRPLPKRGVAAARRVGFVLLFAWLALNAFLILRDAASAIV